MSLRMETPIRITGHLQKYREPDKAKAKKPSMI